MSDDLNKVIESAKAWRDLLIASDSAYVFIAVDCVEGLEYLQARVSRMTTAVTVYTDGDTIWVNSAEKCEVRICGLRDLKGMKAIRGVMTDSDNLKDVTITGNVIVDE